MLLDDGIDVGVLRGAPATHPKYAGRRILGSGINLTRLYHGKISLVEFMLERELGAVAKMHRGHDLGALDDEDREDRREKPWIAAVETFAIGGACQWLLVMDRVLAETGSYYEPARAQGGDRPRLRQPAPAAARRRAARAPGDLLQPRRSRPTRRTGRLLADEVVPPGAMGAAIEHSATELMSAGHDEPARQPPAAARACRSRSTSSAAT